MSFSMLLKVRTAWTEVVWDKKWGCLFAKHNHRHSKAIASRESR